MTSRNGRRWKKTLLKTTVRSLGRDLKPGELDEVREMLAREELDTGNDTNIHHMPQWAPGTDRAWQTKVLEAYFTWRSANRKGEAGVIFPQAD